LTYLGTCSRDITPDRRPSCQNSLAELLPPSFILPSIVQRASCSTRSLRHLTAAQLPTSDWLTALRLPHTPYLMRRRPVVRHRRFLMEFDTASQSLSPSAAIHNPTLRLPATCEPPSDSNPPKRAVWIVWRSHATRHERMTDQACAGLWSNRPYGAVSCPSNTSTW
jgi:hypothetical protein